MYLIVFLLGVSLGILAIYSYYMFKPKRTPRRSDGYLHISHEGDDYETWMQIKTIDTLWKEDYVTLKIKHYEPRK